VTRPKRRVGRPAAPRVPDLVDAPELATIALLEAALEMVTPALVAEHMTLIDELRLPRGDGPVVFLADQITRRAAALLALLARYRRAVEDCQSAASASAPATDDDVF
jgi:hypothetical protein